MWARLSGGNLVAAPGIQGLVSVFTFSPDPEGLMPALAAAVGADVIPGNRGILNVVASVATKATTTLTSEGIHVRDVVRHFAPLSSGIEVDAAVAGRVSVFVAGANVFDVLRAAAVATGHGLVRRTSAYVIE